MIDRLLRSCHTGVEYRWVTYGPVGNSPSNQMHLMIYSSCLSLVLFRVVSHGVHAGEILLLPHQVSGSGQQLLWSIVSCSNKLWLSIELVSSREGDWEEGGSQQLWAFHRYLHLVARWELTTTVLVQSILLAKLNIVWCIVLSGIAWINECTVLIF